MIRQEVQLIIKYMEKTSEIKNNEKHLLVQNEHP